MQLAGELSKMNLASLIRLVRNGELTGKICIAQGVNSAFIFFENGQPIHVESDRGIGRRALLELFAWQTGTFSYVECDVSEQAHSMASDEPLEKLLKEGLAFQDSLRYLEQLRVNARTIFRQSRSEKSDAFLSCFDGTNSLADVVRILSLSRSEYVPLLHKALVDGKLVVSETAQKAGEIKLPDWVILRLKQENLDVSQAIVDLVVWADRVKCWLYQADVDMHRIITKFDEGEEQNEPETREDNSNSQDYTQAAYEAEEAAEYPHTEPTEPTFEQRSSGDFSDQPWNIPPGQSDAFLEDNTEQPWSEPPPELSGALPHAAPLHPSQAWFDSVSELDDPVPVPVQDPPSQIQDTVESGLQPRQNSAAVHAKIPLRGDSSSAIPSLRNSMPVKIPLRGSEQTASPPLPKPPSRPQAPVPPSKPTPPNRPDRTKPSAPAKVAQPPSYDF